MGNEFHASELGTCLNKTFVKCAAFSQFRFILLYKVTQAGKTSSENLKNILVRFQVTLVHQIK